MLEYVIIGLLLLQVCLIASIRPLAMKVSRQEFFVKQVISIVAITAVISVVMSLSGII
jgi:hypothetical protein